MTISIGLSKIKDLNIMFSDVSEIVRGAQWQQLHGKFMKPLKPQANLFILNFTRKKAITCF